MEELSFVWSADGAADSHADFPYDVSEEDVPRLSLSVFADRRALRDEVIADAVAAGFRIASAGDLGELAGGNPARGADVVLVDCPLVDAAVIAGLSRLDMTIGQGGRTLVVSTSLDALDTVFACLDQSGARILVGPARGERLVALAQAVVDRRDDHVRELSESDRLALARLTDQVSEIGQRLESLRIVSGSAAARCGSDPRSDSHLLGEAKSAFRFQVGEHSDRESDRLVTAASVNGASVPASAASGRQLPDPRLVRTIIRQRQLRARHFPEASFADPMWDMLLDLTAATSEGTDVSVTSLCIASGVPPTTALRLIRQMSDAGLLARREDLNDRRRAFIVLTEKAAASMARYFAALGKEPAPLL